MTPNDTALFTARWYPPRARPGCQGNLSPLASLYFPFRHETGHETAHTVPAHTVPVTL